LLTAKGLLQQQARFVLDQDSIRGVEHLRERFSKRSREVKALTEEFSRKKGRQATKREIEVLVRESRQRKLLEVTTPEVRERQRAELTRDELRALEALVRKTMLQVPRAEISVSQGQAMTVLQAAIRHVYERSSVVREGEVLNAALQLHPQFTDWRALRRALETNPDVIRENGMMTLQSIKREEAATVRLSRCRLPRMLENLRLAFMAAVEERRQMRESRSQRVEV